MVDDKDSRFPQELKKIIAAAPIKSCLQKIYELIEAGRASAVIFMGDLTDYGGLAGYKACAKYISTALQIGRFGQQSQLPVGIVPGNHDVNRALAQEAQIGAKFSPLIAALAAEGLPSIPVAEPIWMNVLNDAAQISLRVALLNSCWGCGAKEFIPEEFREDVQAAIESALKRGQPDQQIAAYYDRQFDTPAFSSDTMEKLVSRLPAVNECGVLVVAAHHNLLPQQQPRLAPYTELVNSGAIRSVLQNLERPVIYLHGHIHHDPIEIIQKPASSPVVSIAAPEIQSGFNVIELVYTRSHLPLNCRVVKMAL